MPNLLLTSTKVTRESLRVLHNNLVFTKGVNRQYDDQFAVVGAKIGNSINIRLPNQYTVRKGPALAAQNTVNTTTPLTLTTQWGVDVNFTTAELTLSLDDFGKLILTPAMARLTSQIDQDGLAMFHFVYNQVGFPGVIPGNAGGVVGTMTNSAAPAVYLDAGVFLSNFATPKDENRRIVLSPFANAASVSALAGLLQAGDLIAEQYRRGVLGLALGFEFAEDQNINMLTTGTHLGFATAVVRGAGQTGASLNTSGWTPTSAGILQPGEIFTIAGVNSVNPENQTDTGLPAYFVVGGWSVGPSGVITSTPVNSDAAGWATIPISPPIIPAGPGVANATVTNSPANNAVITLMSGAANTNFPQLMAYHQDAFALGTADLEMPGGVDFSGRETYDGISIRLIRQYDINQDQLPCRIDVLGGWAAPRPSMAVRITS